MRTSPAINALIRSCSLRLRGPGSVGLAVKQLTHWPKHASLSSLSIATTEGAVEGQEVCVCARARRCVFFLHTSLCE